jgi:hypothetical protein
MKRDHLIVLAVLALGVLGTLLLSRGPATFNGPPRPGEITRDTGPLSPMPFDDPETEDDE